MPGRRQLPYRAVDFPPIDGGLRGSVSPHQPAGLRPLSEQTELAGIALKAAVSTLRRPARLPVRRLATTPPTTLAGVAAVLRFANEIEDGGMEWPATDAVGPEDWHYQLRATMAAAIEALIKAQAGKAVAS